MYSLLQGGEGVQYGGGEQPSCGDRNNTSNTLKRKYSWLEHNSVCNGDHGCCNWEKFPGK